ncbi:anti-anti-sigma factor [Micrococcales bacterium KH10]|nr:anti-anti-sigma factor [Micrococcales bacterium KH10]
MPNAAIDTTSGSGALHIIVQSDEIRVVLTGEIDANLASEFSTALETINSEALPVTFDTRHVTFMDSFGVAFVSQVAMARPGQTRVIHVPPTVKFLFEVTSTADLVEVVE